MSAVIRTAVVRTLRFAPLIGVILFGFLFAAAQADPNADRQRIHDQQIQQQRNTLDNRINAGRRQLEAAQRERDRINQSLPEMQKKIAEARAATVKMQPEVEAARLEVDNLRAKWKDATDQIRKAQEKLDAAADKVEKDQPSDSPLAAAKDRYAAARAKYQAAVDRVLGTAEYKKAYADAQESGDKLKAADVRSTFLTADKSATDLGQATKAARTEYESLRDKLVHNDSVWQAASEDLKQARDAEAAIRKEGTASQRKANEALRRYKNQAGLAQRGELMYRQGQATVQQFDKNRRQMEDQIHQLEQQKNNLR